MVHLGSIWQGWNIGQREVLQLPNPATVASLSVQQRLLSFVLPQVRKKLRPTHLNNGTPVPLFRSSMIKPISNSKLGAEKLSKETFQKKVSMNSVLLFQQTSSTQAASKTKKYHLIDLLKVTTVSSAISPPLSQCCHSTPSFQARLLASKFDEFSRPGKHLENLSTLDDLGIKATPKSCLLLTRCDK